MSDPWESATQFGRALRAEGMPVGSGQIIDFCRAAGSLPETDLYWAGLVTLVNNRDEIDVYDRVFRAFFSGHTHPETGEAQAQAPMMAWTAHTTGLAEETEEEPDGQVSQASHIEVLREKSFADCTPDELGRLFAASKRLPIARRRSRRYRPARKGAPDFRRTLRTSFRTGAEPVHRAWRARHHRPRKMVLLLDVSGSMAAYTRALLFFARAVVRTERRCEVFCFSTRLTRVTNELATGTPDEALQRACGEVVDWEGGTRIGDSLKRFLDSYGHGGLARGAVVVVCSDGLEFGDPAALGRQMLRLYRLAHRIVWFNPLKQDPEYEPLARGMNAALPHVQVLSSGHNLASLVEGLAATLEP